MQIDEFLKQRNELHASYTTAPQIKRSSSSRSKNKAAVKEGEDSSQGKEKKQSRERSKKKRWYNLHLKGDKKKPCGMD